MMRIIIHPTMAREQLKWVINLFCRWVLISVFLIVIPITKGEASVSSRENTSDERSSYEHSSDDKPISSIRTVAFDDSNPSIILGSHLQYAVDRSGLWSLDDVLDIENDSHFTNVLDPIPSFGFTDKPHWFRLVLKYEGELEEVTKELELAYPLLEFIDYYEINHEGVNRNVLGGKNRDLMGPDIKSRSFVVRIHLKRGETKKIMIKVAGQAMLNLPYYLWDISARRQWDQTQMLVFGVYYGIIIVMFLYNLFLFLSMKFISYFYYLCYILSLGLFMLTNDGLIREYIVGNNQWINIHGFWTLMSTTGLTAILFFRQFLHIKIRHPNLDRVLRLIIGLYLSGLFLSFLDYSIFSNYIIIVATISCTSCLLIGGAISLYKGYREAKFFMMAWSIVLIGATVLMLTYLGLIPVNIYTLHAVHFGSAIEVLLLSFVLADRINTLVSEKLSIEKLARAELHNSHQQLRASHRLKDDFLGSIGQELIVPINGVVRHALELSGSRLSQDQIGFLNTAINSARSMMFLVNDLIRFTENSENVIHVSKPFSLRGSFEYIRLRYWAKCQRQGLLFHYNVDESIPDRLKGDGVRLHVVLYGLLDNAVKFTQDGSVNFAVRSQLKDNEKNKVTLIFSISDTGKGIPQEQQQSIFSPFSLVDASTNRAEDGLGLGLALCKKTADIMKGAIVLSSVVDKGTEVTFTVDFEIDFDSSSQTDHRDEENPVNAGLGSFPLLMTEESLENKNPFEKSHKNTLSPSSNNFSEDVSSKLKTSKSEAFEFEALEFKSKRVLIVEDNVVNQTVMKSIVEKLGCVANISNNGQEAVDYLKQNQVDLVFMDCQMPIKDGYEATRDIRCHEADGFNVPIIAVTANVMSGDKARCLESGMDDYVKKPVKLAAIKAVLKNYLIASEPSESA